MALYDNLFEPLQVGGCTIPNRIVRSPHGTGLLGEELLADHEARAKGGVGMSTIQATGVHPNAPTGIPIWREDSVGLLKERPAPQRCVATGSCCTRRRLGWAAKWRSPEGHHIAATSAPLPTTYKANWKPFRSRFVTTQWSIQTWLMRTAPPRNVPSRIGCERM